MAQEIGVAYVSLLPSGRGFSKAVQGEAESAFKGAEKSSDGFFSNVTKWAKRGAVVVAGMVTAVGALALGGGISRALNIEDATAKLKGLGHDTQAVQSIMKDALASVKGTAFGLDAAATTAASAVAAGIKPGAELERYLRLTADAATIAGISMSEMGSIINQVTSKGYAGMENMNRLTERGIPIMQWLQKEYGVTADELAKMVSRGEIDAATFRKVIEDNIGGAALESGNTTRGAFSNMLASLSRLGEGFAGPALGAAKDFFNEVTKITDAVKTVLKPAFADLQHWIDGVDFSFSGDVMAFLTPLLTTINEISAAARAGVLKEWLEGAAESSPLLAMLMGLADAVTPLMPLLKSLGSVLGPALAITLGKISDAILPMIPLIGKELVRAIIAIAPPLVDLLLATLPLIPPLLQLMKMILPPLVWLIGVLAPVVAGIADGFTQWLSAMQIFDNFINNGLGIDGLYEAISKLTGPIHDVMKAFVDMTLFITLTMRDLSSAWIGGWTIIGDFFAVIGQTILGIGATIWAALPEGFKTAVTNVVTVFSSLHNRIQAIMSGIRSWLVGAGQSLMQGFIDGINSMIRNVGNSINSVLEWAKGFFPHSPAKRGVFAGSGWTDVFEGGEALIGHFALGAETYKPEISFTNLSGIMGAATTPTISMPSELVVRDVNDELVGRMGVEAQGKVSENGTTVARAVRNRRWSDA